MEDASVEIDPLPEELVGKIMSRVPLPQLLNVRALSKAWCARFSRVSDLKDEVQIQRATLFQQQIAELSRNSTSIFSPVFYKSHPSFFTFRKYRDTGERSRMPSLQFLPEEVRVDTSNPDVEGPFVCWCTRADKLICIYVANFLSKRWRELPRLPDAEGSILVCSKLVLDASLKTYKVFVFSRHPQTPLQGFRAQIYDSKSHAWTCNNPYVDLGEERLDRPRNFTELSRPVLLNGVLYMVPDLDMNTLLAFDVKQATLTEIPVYFTRTSFSITNAAVVVCNGDLFMIVTEGDSSEGLYVLKVDLETQQLCEVARGPSEAFSMGGVKLLQPVSDGDNIFFGVAAQRGDEDHMVEYNVKRNRWRFPKFAGPEYSVRLSHKKFSTHEWSPVTYQPLNPFLEV
ncbi:unnamed protein product [Calypogeia fissa]